MSVSTSQYSAYPERRTHSDHIHAIKHVTLYRVRNVQYCQELIPNNATIKNVYTNANPNLLLHKSVKIDIYVNGISLISDLVYLCTKWTKKLHKNIQSYHLYTANYPKETYTGKHVELTVAQGASTETAHFITKHYITFTGDLMAYCATRHTRNATWQTSTTLNSAHTNTIPTSRLPHSMSLQYM